ncbi:MAG: hypothetical protein ABFR47_06220 [Verrucomicrobiota bacterium]
MSDTDIYKSKKQAPVAPTKPRRRRSSSNSAFDETGNRRRRSKNSGVRRLLHLMRKSDNEKEFWLTVLIAIVVILSLLAIWQFWYLEHVARGQSRLDEMNLPTSHQSQTESAVE